MPAMTTQSTQTLENTLRAFLATSAMALGLAASASIPAVALAASPAVAAPQCWSSKIGQFAGVSSQALISSVTVGTKSSRGDDVSWKSIK